MSAFIRTDEIVPLLLLAIVTIACGTDTPEPPAVTPGPPETVAGTERLGWTQRATDAAELSTFRYAIYVDGARAELTGVSCQPLSPQTSSDFDCSAPLPPMSTGPHTLELATFIVDGDLLESARSAPLQVNRTSAPTAVAPAPPATWASGTTVSTADGLRLRIDRIAEGLVRPTDIAFLPDGRVLVAEEAGQVRVLMPDGRLLAEPALSLRRRRIRTKHGSLRSPSTRASPDTLRVCDLRDGVWRRPAVRSDAFPGRPRTPSSNLSCCATTSRRRPARAASLRGGADGTVFAAFDDGGDVAEPGRSRVSERQDPAPQPRRHDTRRSGRLHIRCMPRTFTRRAASTGRPESTLLWIADRGSENSATSDCRRPGEWRHERRGVRLASYALPRGTVPSSVAFYRATRCPRSGTTC